ncbi:MAG: glycosyltransferase [Bacteroidetes bacterium]|nr:glycosyltransferase [Bacteroidota bacterium]
MSTSAPTISVVIPVYNNQNTLVELTKQLTGLFSQHNLSFQIIYVNDASKDQSAALLKKLQHENEQIACIYHEINRGQHLAILSGLKYANGDYVVVMDADLQDNPLHIYDMYKSISSENEAVFILRRGIYQSKMRMFTSWGIKSIVRNLVGLHHKAGSFFLMSQSILQNVVNLASNCKYPYITIIAAHCAGHISYVAANRSKPLGDSNYTFKKRLSAAYKALYCAVYCKTIAKSIRG